MSSEEEEKEKEENAAELKLGEDFQKEKCLTYGEVAMLLKQRLTHKQEEGESKMPQAFEKSLEYVDKFNRYKSPDAVLQVREILIRHELSEFEVAVIGNLCPDSVEEATSLVPSLKGKGRGLDHRKIEKMLDEIELVRKFD